MNGISDFRKVMSGKSLTPLFCEDNVRRELSMNQEMGPPHPEIWQCFGLGITRTMRKKYFLFILSILWYFITD